MPASQVAETEPRLDEWIHIGVRAQALREEIVHLESVREPRQVKKLEHGKDDEKEAHEILHRRHPVPGWTVGDSYCRGRGHGEEEDDDQRNVIGPVRATSLL